MRTVAMTLLTAALLGTGAFPAAAETCTREQFRKVVDGAGASLRRLNAESQPAVEAAMRRLKAKFAWTDEEYAAKADALLNDAKTETYDAKASELLSKLDQLAEGAPGATPDCSKLGELEATALELQATVRVKTRHMLARIEEQLGQTKSAAADPAPAASAPATPVAPATSPPAAKPAQSPPQAKSTQAAPSVSQAQPAPTPKPPAGSAAPKGAWTTSTSDDAVPTAPSALARPAPPMPALPPTTDGFSVDEIHEASRGFFGTISSALGNVIEHAFGKLGRPTAYVLGKEGGGAFIAGVRYGKGTLFTRGGRSREVYWHGPSIGYDFGAAGSKTLFLVYGLRDELDVFTGFSGVDGSAYLVGGVGMTLLTDGRMVMAPIRSGVGLRLGANIGYLRFTAQPTWNPF